MLKTKIFYKYLNFYKKISIAKLYIYMADFWIESKHKHHERIVDNTEKKPNQGWERETRCWVQGPLFCVMVGNSFSMLEFLINLLII